MKIIKSKWSGYALLFGMTVLLLAGYALMSQRYYRTGFPLDDAWIHQTFARNLFETGQWAFVAGEPSSGSTSPLWTVILTLGYVLGIQPVTWSYLLGGIVLFLTGVICDLTWRRSTAIASQVRMPVLGFLIVAEWHLLWASLSGMETMLYILLICLLMYLLSSADPNWFMLGLLSGSAVWIRPDGATLLGPVLFLAVLKKDEGKSLRNVLFILLGFLLLLLPYFLFNYQIDGAILPNTFFAKQAEYAALLNAPLIARWFKLFLQLQVGVDLLLLPGFLYLIYLAITKRAWWDIALILWVMGYVAMYALRLPVIYQHVRYLMPAIPVYLLLGYKGMFHLIMSSTQVSLIMRVLKKSWVISVIGVSVAFYVLGAFSFSKDVAIIESEMVTTALWIEENTPENALIAAHDIGALGYYGSRKIVDLAGLVNPEVITFIRDETQLLNFIDQKGADYLMTFPDWYPFLVSHFEQVYNTNNPYSPAQGGENMSVYEVR